MTVAQDEFRRWFTKTAASVIGIPDRNTTHEISEPPGKWDYLFSQHDAKRAGRHIDVRLAPNDRSHSWATRRLPEPGEKVLAVRQPTHTRDYHSFQGVIPSGYGAGSVRTLKSGIAHVVESAPDKLHFNVHEGRKTHEYALVKTQRNPKDWLLMNLSTTPGKYKIPHEKGSYKETKFSDELAQREGVLTPKVDGAHAIILLEPNKRVRAFSYRNSKRGDVLEYTHKIPGLFTTRTPKDVKKAILRGEVVLVGPSGKALSADRTAAILNSGVEKALAAQGKDHLRILPFDIVGSQDPYADRLAKMHSISKSIPQFITPEGAHTPEAKKALIASIREGRHPLTQEGVVHWGADGPTKAKIVDEKDVYVTDVFPGKGKYSESAGGFWYSRQQDGKHTGKVGSGFTDAQRAALWKHRERMRNSVAKVSYNRETRRGALFGPRFTGWHVDKNVQ